MSRNIAKLLDEPEKLVAKAVDALEAKNGYPSHDVRHLAETVQTVRRKLSDLGLDPDDTTGEELYQALLAKFQTDSRLFDAQNGVEAGDFAARAAKAIELISINSKLPERWVLKNSAAKAILKQHPSKKVMKQLRYRSIDSMLKRQPPAKLFLAAELCESAAWLKAQTKLVSQQDSISFELRPLQLGSLSADAHQPIAFSNETGYLAIVENDLTTTMPLLSIVVQLADALAAFKPDETTQLAAISPVLAWWQDMDSLIASLAGEPVSLSLKDVSQNSLAQPSYADRLLDKGRASFWRNLLARYENQLEIEEDALAGLKDRAVQIKAPLNQPAFEYVEDI